MLRWVWKPKRLLPILLKLLMRNNGQSGHEYKPDKHNNGLQIYSNNKWLINIQMQYIGLKKYWEIKVVVQPLNGFRLVMATAGSRLFICWNFSMHT
jgi:hypothetical protein